MYTSEKLVDIEVIPVIFVKPCCTKTLKGRFVRTVFRSYQEDQLYTKSGTLYPLIPLTCPHCEKNPKVNNLFWGWMLTCDVCGKDNFYKTKHKWIDEHREENPIFPSKSRLHCTYCSSVFETFKYFSLDKING